MPPLEGRVNDRAGIISEPVRQRIEQRLLAYEQSSGHQFAVLTLTSLEGDALEDFSIRVVERWKLGKKGKDDGLLLLVVKNDKKVRIEVGYGLEGTITDALSSRVVRNLIAPAFRQGDYAGGIERALDALMTAASGGKLDLPNAEPEGEPEQRRGMSLGRALGYLVMFLIFGPLLPLFLLGRRGGPRGPRGGGFAGGMLAGSLLGGGWSSGRGGGGGGGFSGGGGGFGGGGASGSW